MVTYRGRVKCKDTLKKNSFRHIVVVSNPFMGESNRVSSLDNYIAYTTVVAETTQKSAESVGESFKTLYARFGKIAAGKFETSQEELEQQGLSSEDMSNLNEIEQVLKAVGIELRDTPEHFRNIDSVLAEIAGKWNTFSDVQKSGIATAVAGTRQRENFLVLMENWDNVGKYAEIAANAYGTAVEKMEAYSQGVEAARKRVQAAWEGFALIVNESGALETAFNALATAIENLHLIVLSVIGALVVNNPEAALGTLTKAFTKVGAFLNSRSLDAMLGTSKTDVFTKDSLRETRQQAEQAAFVAQKQVMFGDYLGKYRGSLDDSRFAGMVELQSALIGLDKNNANNEFIQSLTQLAGGVINKDESLIGPSLHKLKMTALSSEQALAILGTVSKENAEALVKSRMATVEGTTNEEKLSKARILAAQDLLEDISKGERSEYYDAQARRTFGAAVGSGSRGYALEQKELQRRAYASMMGSAVGSYGARTLMGAIAAGVGGEDARGAGESIGTVIGMFAGEKAGSTLYSTISKVLAGTAAKSALIAPVLGVAVLAIGAIIGLVSAARKKEIEKAQNEFKELKDTYESQLSASTKTSRYDELSKGVDQFGRNVSLTDEEYSEFLSTSNELAEIFPELVVRTDEAGNSFLGTAGKVNKLTDAVNDMVKASQKAADQQLLNKDVFGEAFDDAKKDAENKEHQLNSLKDLLNKQEKALANGGTFEVTDSFGGTVEVIKATEKDINKTKNAISNLEKELAQMSAPLTDYNNAIMREDFGLQATLSSMSEDSAILAKQTMQKVFSSLDLTQYANEDEYRADIEKISNEIAEIYRDNPIIATMEVEMSSSATSGEYYAVRQKILQNIIDAFGDYATWDDTQKMFVLQMGFKWSEDTGWVDTTDIRQKIKDEGLDSRLVRGAGMLDAFSVSDLESAYQILKSSSYGTQFNENQLRSAIFSSENSEVGLKKIVSLYEQYKDLENPTEVDESNLKFLQTQMSLWGKELRVVKSDYSDINDYCDEIARKSKFFGDMDKFGTSTEDPKEKIEKRDKYLKYYNFLKDEYSKTGKWDLDTYDDMIRDSNLQEFVATNNISGLTNYFEEYFKNFPADLKNSYQAILWNNADLNEQMQKEHKDLYDAYEKDYGIDLTKFANMNVAKAAIDKLYSSIMTNSWADWRDAMFMYYGEVLDKYSDMASKIAALNSLMLKDLFTYSSGVSGDEIDEFTDASYSRWYMAGGEAGTGMTSNEWLSKDIRDYTQKKRQKETEAFIKKGVEDAQAIINTMPTGKYDTKDKGTSDLNKNIERIEALIGMYQKEYYLRKSLIEQGNLTAEGQDSFMFPEYYDRMRNAYQMQADYYKQRIPWNKDISQWSAEQMGYYQKYQQAMINLNNLDDEQVEDKINILQLQDVSYDQLIAAQRELLATSDTLEEEISRRKEINNLIKQQIELQMDVQKWQREIADIALEYEKGTPDTSAYESLIAAKRTSLQADLDTIEARLNWIRYDQSDEAKQYRGSKEADQEIRDKTKQWLETYQELASIPLDVLNDKLDILEKKLDLLEKSKPNEWGAYDQIENYYSSNINYLEQKAALIREQLEDVSMLTDEQVQDLVDQLNDVTVALREAQINLLQDQKDYKDSQYDAIVSKVNEYKDEIQDAIDAIEKAYEEEVKPIQDVNDELERQAKLEDLLAAKKSLAREKERVYRSGIGWTYETPRDKRKENAKEIDDFYRQDRLDDLEKTKDAEIANLNERIEQWDLYLKALDWRYNEAQRIERDRLLAELFGLDQSMSNADLQKEIYDRIFNDMTEFNANCEGSYKEYIGIFSNFLQEYTALVLQLAELQRQALALMDSAQYLGLNNYENIPVPRGWTTLGEGTGGYGGGSSGSYGYASDYQAVINRILGDKSNYGSDGKLLPDAKARIDSLEGLRNEKIDNEGLSYNKTYGQSNATWGGGSSSGGSGNKTSSSSPYNSKTDYNNESKYLDNLIKNGSAGQKAWAQNQKKELDKAQKGYADGIENGPVTYTGLSMLHGTYSKPEYVLNSDQAYNLLRNLATTKLPEYTSTLSQDMGVSYVIQGDVVLENCDDPAQFWNQVMAATHNRYNVTKNKR